MMELKPTDAFGYLQKRVPAPGGTREARLYLSGAYVGQTRLVLDGQLIDTGDIEALTFSPDDRRFAYVKQTHQGKALIEQGRLVAIAEGFRGPWFSPEGEHLAYVAVVADGRNQQEFAFIDGQEVERYLWVPWGMDYWSWSPPWSAQASPIPDDFRQTRETMSRENRFRPPRAPQAPG